MEIRDKKRAGICSNGVGRHTEGEDRRDEKRELQLRKEVSGCLTKLPGAYLDSEELWLGFYISNLRSCSVGHSFVGVCTITCEARASR